MRGRDEGKWVEGMRIEGMDESRRNEERVERRRRSA